MARRLLLTGPVGGLDAYAEAAGLAGWEVALHPLVEVRHRDLDADGLLAALPHWVAITSSNALPALSGTRDALAETPFACVGARTAERLKQLGFRVQLEPAADAKGLAESLSEAVSARVRPGTRVLWPRGSLSTELGSRLLDLGFLVEDPVVYETLPSDPSSSIPTAEVVFFASPSAVRRYVELVRFVDRRPPLAVAIGATTLGELERFAEHHFRAFQQLERPRPTDLGAILAEIAADRS